MLTASVSRVVEFCTRHFVWAVVCGVVLGLLAGGYTARNFSLNSDIGALLSPKLGWRQREAAFEQAFRRYQLLAVVVEAPTPELTAAATDALSGALKELDGRFENVADASAQSYFSSHMLLYLSMAELETTLAQLERAEPLLSDVATDPSLRGLVAMLEDALIGVQRGNVKLDDLSTIFDAVAVATEEVLASRQTYFSWRVLMQGHPASARELRGFIEIRPVLDYGALEPGRAATLAVRRVAAEIAPRFQARVRLTGPIALADDEFSKVKENSVVNSAITAAVVLSILWFALRSYRLICAVIVNLFVGLALTAACGLLLVGAFNVISVSFAVLFVGIGIDFAIQYGVKYRAERFHTGALPVALTMAGRRLATPLTLAAMATAAGFLSFLPTDYKGVAELGLIAGLGMVIAFVTSLTLLPALIRMFDPPGEQEPLELAFLAPLDGFLMRHRIAIISVTALLVAFGLPLLSRLTFDFDPMHLRDPKSEPVATYLDLAKDPESGVNAVEALYPSLAGADAAASRIGRLDEVSRVTTLSSFVPDGQAEKITRIGASAGKLSGLFDASSGQAAPSDMEQVGALREGAQRLTEIADGMSGAGAMASLRLGRALASLAAAAPELRIAADRVFVAPLKRDLGYLKQSLAAEPVSLQSLPEGVRAGWIAADGRARLSISPKGVVGGNDQLRRFSEAVLAVEPNAVEGPISIYEAGKTIVGAFVEAGLLALVSIFLILWLVLRKIGDVLLTIVPLLLAGVVTLELCVVFGMPLNFANIIALPLLLGVGVAFKIYYITAWRDGQVHLLQTSLTRAVVFSAMTTATAFGSLWFSSHPGTSSMGKLLALSLVSTLAAAVLFQPILMGPPRVANGSDRGEGKDSQSQAEVQKE